MAPINLAHQWGDCDPPANACLVPVGSNNVTITTTSNGTGDTYWINGGNVTTLPYIQHSPYTVGGTGVTTGEIADIVRKALADKDATRERQKMRGLYECFVVDYKAGDIVFEKRLVADDENKARLKAAVLAKIDDPDEYDIIVRKIGDVRTKKQVQEVRVVKDAA